MTVSRLAFLFGVLELAFVLLVAGVIPRGLFVLWGAAACVALCAPEVRAKVSDGRSRRPKTVADGG